MESTSVRIAWQTRATDSAERTAFSLLLIFPAGQQSTCIGTKVGRTSTNAC